MVKNIKSGWETTYPNEPETPSKFKRDLESSTAMPETFEEGIEFVRDRTWETKEGLRMTVIKEPCKNSWDTLEALHFHNVKTMRAFFYMENQDPPLSISATDDEKVFCFHGTDGMSKEEMCKTLRKIFIKENIQRYAVIAGAWYTTHGKDEKPDCPPSQSSKKKECIFLYSEDRNGKFCFSGWDIITRNGLRELKEIHNSINKDIDPKDDAYTRGKFMGLLQHIDKEGEK